MLQNWKMLRYHSCVKCTGKILKATHQYKTLYKTVFFGSVRRYSDEGVRVRFAPSPTGQLHLGGLRTALYNFLFARSNGGKILLRIEDTDQTRIVPGAMEKLIEMLDWSGIEIDEGPCQGGQYGPYLQSERKSLYWEMIKTLVENGTAYRCFCTEKRLDLLRKDALRRRQTPKYDNRCRHLTDSQIENKMNSNEPFVIRFKLQHYTDAWEDLVYGPITTDVASIEGDPVLLKTDGFPTYHFANVVDDHLMRISHVLRGVEWQASTTKHILLYNAFGWQPPKFAHLPLLLNKDGNKLSKRHGDVHIEQFKDKGYFAESILSLLTAAGSGFDVKDTHLMTMQELIKHFDLHKVNTNSTKVDTARVADFNRQHLKRKLASAERERLVEQVRTLVKGHFQERFQDSVLDEKILSDVYINSVFDWGKDRVHRLADFVSPDLHFLWLLPTAQSVSQLKKQHEQADELLKITLTILDSMQTFNQPEIAKCLRNEATHRQLQFGNYMSLLRQAISGLKEGPAVAEMMSILGQAETTDRLKSVLHRLPQTTATS